MFVLHREKLNVCRGWVSRKIKSWDWLRVRDLICCVVIEIEFFLSPLSFPYFLHLCWNWVLSWVLWIPYARTSEWREMLLFLLPFLMYNQRADEERKIFIIEMICSGLKRFKDFRLRLRCWEGFRLVLKLSLKLFKVERFLRKVQTAFWDHSLLLKIIPLSTQGFSA